MGNTYSQYDNDNTEQDLWWSSPVDTVHTNDTAPSQSLDSGRTRRETTSPERRVTETNPFAEFVVGPEHASRHAPSNDLELFKRELSEKRVARQAIMDNKRKEIQAIRDELVHVREENVRLKRTIEERGDRDTSRVTEEDESVRAEVGFLRNEVVRLKDENRRLEAAVESNGVNKNDFEEMKKQIEFLNSEMESIEQEREAYKTHVTALKDCIGVSKQMLQIRDKQLVELKQRIDVIQRNLADREAMMMSEELRTDYERQLRNIRNLRALYEERARIERLQCRKMTDQLADARLELEAATNKNNELQQRITELETDVSNKYDQIASLQSELGLTKAECNGLHNEMAVINQLFAQILSTSNSCQDVDLDQLIKVLEENHDLLSDIVVKEDSSELSTAMPKLILELVNQTNQNKSRTVSVTESEPTDADRSGDDAAVERENDPKDGGNAEPDVGDVKETGSPVPQNSAAMADEIVSNLPKVWRVLTELLSHQSINPVKIHQPSDGQNPCYTSVDTPSGSRYVLSVSKTYIRLKDLILEKKFLQKEMMRMKFLNTHLEERLRDQEKRMGEVSSELVKTWSMAGKLQRQHHKLHTHEKILRYELSQKRKLLTELKDELEYCREKWEQAREKNNDSETQCQQLRSEFRLRKSNTFPSIDVHSGSESGFSDEAGNEDSDCGEALAEQDAPIRGPDGAEPCSDPIDGPKTAPAESDDSSGECTDRVETCCDANKVPTSDKDEVGGETNAEPAPTPRDTETAPTEPDRNLADIDERFLRRERKFKALEEEFGHLRRKYADQARRGTEMCSKMDDLHERYGRSSPAPAGEPSTSRSDQSDGGVDPLTVLDERQERFRRLEEQCDELKKKYATQSEKGDVICTKLDSLHQQFGGETQDGTETATGSRSTECADDAASEETDVPAEDPTVPDSDLQ